MPRVTSSYRFMHRYALMLLFALPIACSEQQQETARLASGCINASPDNRVKLSGSWSNSFDVQVEGDEITVRTEVPVGIALTGRIKFGKREFRCRKTGERIEFVSAVWEQPAR
ncbi:MAG TPA: hypothetical protein VLS27_06660 [Gammaproteobacteria bacterium]|nr:hypothetical protein [Gammaproteobacteria bacterium]